MIKTGSILLFSGALALAGCGSSDSAEVECYPGDVDCNPLVGSGEKGDNWNSDNDPAGIMRNLNYRVADLPMQGEAENLPWAASYWPTVAGSTNYRWQGLNSLSPLEKFDVAKHNWTPNPEYAESVPKDCGDEANVKYSAYVDTLGPAASWQATAQSRHLLFNGRNDDPDDDDVIDECYERLESWWGLCHSWAPAAILEPEALHAVEYNGVKFEVSDVKALVITVYDGTVSRGIGGRCNDKEVDHDDTGRVIDEVCRDTNAGAWHVVATNLLGLHKRSFVEDRTANFQVWNQPMIGYEITKQEEVTAKQANELLNTEGETYAYSAADQFFEVKMESYWLTEGQQSTKPLGTDNYKRTDNYHYILEVTNGKISGGEWIGTSRDEHPDFLWLPLRARTGWNARSNPNVSIEDMHTILELSRQGQEPEPTEGETFSTEPGTAIPDADPRGITAELAVETTITTIKGMSVSVDITHSYVGDLIVTLTSPSGKPHTLHEKGEGGSSDDLVKTYSVDTFDGEAAAGTWTMSISDNAAIDDNGMLNKFSLTFLR